MFYFNKLKTTCTQFTRAIYQKPRESQNYLNFVIFIRIIIPIVLSTSRSTSNGTKYFLNLFYKK